MLRRSPAAMPLLLGFAITFTAAASAPNQREAVVAGDLSRLIDTHGVSGYEADITRLIRSALPVWAKPRVDEIGNLLVSIGAGRPHTLVAASVDEDGHVVSGVTPDGYLRLHRVTSGAAHRLFDQFVYGQPVVVRTADGRAIPGVAATASTHLLRGAQTSSAPRGLDDLWIDVGASSRAEVARLGIRMLDVVGLRERSQVLANGLTAGIAAQTRGHALALLAAVAGIEKAPAVNGTLSFAWTVQGVFGDRGLARLLQDLAPDRIVLVSRTPPLRDGDARGLVGRPGAGPMVSESDVAANDAARQAGVAVQSGLAVKPPAEAAKLPVSALALPVVFAQTPAESVSAADVAALGRLLAAVAGITGAGDPWARGPLLGRAPTTALEPGPAGREPAIFGTLRPLIEAYGVSGRESLVRELVARMLPRWAAPEVDEHGNLTVTFGKGPRELVFVAHTDEIGYEITAVLDDGSATVRKRGGFMDSLMEAHPALVHASKGIVPAVVSPRPNYLRAAEWQPRSDELRLVFGTTTRAETEAVGVAVGDTVTVRKRFAPLLAPRVTARSLDDRAGCAVLIEALRRIDPAKVTARVTFAWVIGEETGLVGSRQLAARAKPELAFAIDTFVSSDSPLDNQRTSLVPLGSGAVLRGMDGASITPAGVLTRLQALASTHGIPVTIGVTGGGTDASSFTRTGAVPMPLSWPGRYSHSAVEVADARDLEALVALVVALATAFEGGAS